MLYDSPYDGHTDASTANLQLVTIRTMSHDAEPRDMVVSQTSHTVCVIRLLQADRMECGKKRWRNAANYVTNVCVTRHFLVSTVTHAGDDLYVGTLMQQRVAHCYCLPSMHASAASIPPAPLLSVLFSTASRAANFAFTPPPPPDSRE